MDPPPTTPAIAAISAAANLPRTDSLESSPRSQETESLDGPLPPVSGLPKLYLICSHGGHIVPRPNENSFLYYYVGGDTRMMLVDRNISMSDLYARIAKTLSLRCESFRLKYRLPNGDLDSLVSLFVEEDLHVMIQEYDRFKKPRMRLFVFPSKSESIASSFGSFLDGSVNSDEWFLSALNGFPDSSSVKLGFDLGFGNGKSVKASNEGIQSVPDSSFNSMNSISVMANSPSVRVCVSDGRIRAKNVAHAVDHFVEMPSSGSDQITVAALALTADDERTDQDMEVKKPLQQQQQNHGNAVNSVKQDSFPSDGSLPDATAGSNQLGCQEVVQLSCGESRTSANQVNQKNDFIDGNDVRVQLEKPVQESGSMLHPCIEMCHQPQLVYYVIQQPGNPMPMPAYYPLYPPEQLVQHPHHQSIPLYQPQYPLYIVQAPQVVQGYNMVAQQATYQEGRTVVRPQIPPITSIPNSAITFKVYPDASAAPSLNPELVSTIYGATTTTAGAQQTAQVAQKQFVNYSHVNHQPGTVSAPTPAYTYDIPDPTRYEINFTQPASSSLVSQYKTLESSQALEVFGQPQLSHQSHTAISAPSPAYTHETPDPARSEIYFTQPLSSSLVSHYQTTTSSQALEVADQPQNHSIHPSQV